jgi:2-oxoisovalerate dehydrogenase E2 component (dihydrolipoyl transacylase)
VPAPAAAGEAAVLVEVPLAQTGEGIAECELLRWFVSEVSRALGNSVTPLCSLTSYAAVLPEPVSLTVVGC